MIKNCERKITLVQSAYQFPWGAAVVEKGGSVHAGKPKLFVELRRLTRFEGVEQPELAAKVVGPILARAWQLDPSADDGVLRPILIERLEELLSELNDDTKRIYLSLAFNLPRHWIADDIKASGYTARTDWLNTLSKDIEYPPRRVRKTGRQLRTDINGYIEHDLAPRIEARLSELDTQEQPQTPEASTRTTDGDQTDSGRHKKLSPVEHWLRRRQVSRPVLFTAGGLSLVLAAAITFLLLDTSAIGNRTSGTATVRTCAQQIGEISTAYPNLPSTLTDFRGAPFSSSTMAVYGVTIDGHPHFVVGPGNGSCIFTHTSADGSINIRVLNDADNEGILETYVPGGIGIVSQDTCSAFPDLRSTVNDVRNNNAACPIAQAGGAHRITTGEEVKGLNAGLNEIAAGKGGEDFENNVPPSAKYPTWVLEVANIGFGPVLDFKAISCTVPQEDTAVCVASFDYFLAELVTQFGYGTPNLSAAFNAIQSYVTG